MAVEGKVLTKMNKKRKHKLIIIEHNEREELEIKSEARLINNPEPKNKKRKKHENIVVSDSMNCAEESITEKVEKETVTEDVEKELPEANPTEARLIDESEPKKKKKKKYKNIIETDSTNPAEEIVTEEIEKEYVTKDVEKEPPEANPTEAVLINESEPTKNKKKKHKNIIETGSTNPATVIVTEEVEKEIVTEDVEKELPEANPTEAGLINVSEPKKSSIRRLGILSSITFDELKGIVCAETLKATIEMGFTHLAAIQVRTIPHLLDGHDLVAAAKTGSGKTLAFLIPAIQLIYKLKFMPQKGTGVIILSPTRELSVQTFGVLKELMKYHHHTYDLVIGGTDKKTEANKLSKGINILVATPGRLLDHMRNTPKFLYKNLQCLVIDEADRILDIGFEEELNQILKLLPKRRQTMLFSATLTKKIEALASLALKKEPIYVGFGDIKETATVESLNQGYIVCPSDKKLMILSTFLRKNKKSKIMVFFSNCMSVKFHHELFNNIDLPVNCIHGKQKQTSRTNTFLEFCNAASGVLLCTDLAARGLDIPEVDWVVQYDPPHDLKEYIHRVGRTARGEGGKGHALLILRPEEIGFVPYLKHANVPIIELLFKWSNILDIQLQIEELVTNNHLLRQFGRLAFKSYVRGYSYHNLKAIFDSSTLDHVKVGKSFGFKVPPVVLR